MTVLEFEALLDDGVIHVPEAIAEQLAKGAAVRVSIEPLEKPSMTPDEAWEAFMKTIDERMALPLTSETPYHFNREDAYEHLKKYEHDTDSNH